MKSLNIFRDQLCNYPKVDCFILAVLALVCFVREAYSLDPKKEISQYILDFWEVENGFTGGAIYAITQTSDGYLWIGTEKGLVRFDGLEFKFIQEENSNLYSSEPVVGLLADDWGNLWIQQGKQYLFRYHNGIFENVLMDSRQIKTSVSSMSRSKNGDILFSTLENGVFKYNGGGFTSVIPKTEMPGPIVISIAQTPNGDIWLGTRDKGLFQYGAIENKIISNEMPSSKINCLLSTDDGNLLIGTDKGGIRWDGQKFTQPESLKQLQNSQIVDVIKDRDSNFWISTNSRGIWRSNDARIVTIENGISQLNGTVTSVFEDREGNLWLGTSRGIGRLRDGAFTTYSKAEGLPADNNGPIFVDNEKRTWFGPASGGLYFVKDNHIKIAAVQGLEKDVVYSISGAGQEGLWIGRQNGGLTHLDPEGGKFSAKTYTEKDGLAQNNVYAVHKARDGSVWAGTLSAGVSQLKDGKFKTYTVIDGLALNTVTAMTESSDGTMWFATPGGLSSFDGKTWQTFKSETGLPSDTVNALLIDSTGILWIGTEKGLAFINSDRIPIQANLSKSLNDKILGIAEDRNGSLWIATAIQVIQVNRDKLLKNTLLDQDIRKYDIADGLKSVEGIKRNSSVVGDSEGRIWFSLNRGISMIDPGRLTKFSLPALVHIQKVAADNISLNLRNPISISAAIQNIKIDYIALSLSIPERIKYRYKLEGFDNDWSEPTAAHERIYTNLSPGTYTFHVVSTNNEGLWNSSEASIEFKITPRVWQTLWFQSLCVFAFSLIIICLFRLRIYRLKRQMNRRFEERLAERARIAQDLHDTLLQGFVSTKMQLFAEVQDLSPDALKTKRLKSIYQDLGQLIEAARNTVRDLRASEYDQFTDFEQEFLKIREGFDINKDIAFKMIIRGTPRPLHPLIGSELLQIGHEALINAFLHSRATAIEIEIEYGLKSLNLLVRDNGCGIDSEILRSGREGHWGLTGMHERAEKIKAEIKIRSRVNAGTEVVVSVPGQFAFKDTASFSDWIRQFLPINSENKSNETKSRPRSISRLN